MYLWSYLLSRTAADPAFFGSGISGKVLLNRPHLVEIVDTVPTVLNPWALSISPPITTATSKIFLKCGNKGVTDIHYVCKSKITLKRTMIVN